VVYLSLGILMINKVCSISNLFCPHTHTHKKNTSYDLFLNEVNVIFKDKIFATEKCSSLHVPERTRKIEQKSRD